MARRPLRPRPRPAGRRSRGAGARAAGGHRAEPRADDLHRHPQLLVGEGEVAVIDPGPDDPRAPSPRSRAALGGRAGGGGPRHPRPPRPQRGRPRLRRAPSARRCSAHGDPVGRAVAGDGALAQRRLGGGEGIDRGFRPDRRIGEGATSSRGPGWTLTALATPGHTADHLSFAWAEGDALFSGDHVMGWATTLISPPDGDLAAFRSSLARLQGAARGGLLSRPRRAGPRPAAHRRPHPRAPRARARRRSSLRWRAGPATRRRAGRGASTPASTRRCTALRGATSSPT